MSEETNFGDLIASVAAANAAKAKAAHEAKAAAASEAERVRLEALRPLLTVLRQAKERFPSLPIFNIGYGVPNFYTTSNDRVEVHYDPGSGMIRLQSVRSGYGYYKNELLLGSRNVEDLIPTLVDLLAKLVSK